jgi:NAD(P)-dependent dehydrogenase (short-subunit alcohol dehydrogenase family)
MKELKDRVAVITGAGGGIGRAVAIALAAEGVHVVVSDIEGDNAAAVRDEIIATGARAISHATDVSKFEQVAELADLSFAEFGKVDILINNAGVSLRPFRSAWDTSEEDYRWIINTNIWGVINGIRAFVPRMRQQAGEKYIINTTSMATVGNVAGHSSFTMSKYAVNGYSEVLREELADDGFQVMAFLPGSVPTRVASGEQRLRPAEEQSDNRQVKPYSDYVEERAGRSATLQAVSVPGGTSFVRDAKDMTIPLDAQEVGPILVKAIRNNAPFCVTHKPPVSVMRGRVEAMINGFVE